GDVAVIVCDERNRHRVGRAQGVDDTAFRLVAVRMAFKGGLGDRGDSRRVVRAFVAYQHGHLRLLGCSVDDFGVATQACRSFASGQDQPAVPIITTYGIYAAAALAEIAG